MDTIKTVYSMDTIPSYDKPLFKNIKDVIQYNKEGAWVNIKQDSSVSCELFFNLNRLGSDTLSVEYSPECWLFFPFKYSAEKITVYWDNVIDTKYNFDIVKAVKKVDKKYIGKSFMTLQLLNDTTLQATYNNIEILKRLNSVDTSRLLFPDQYIFKKSFM